jgi:hypothetical protein
MVVDADADLTSTQRKPDEVTMLININVPELESKFWRTAREKPKTFAIGFYVAGIVTALIVGGIISLLS